MSERKTAKKMRERRKKSEKLKLERLVHVHICARAMFVPEV